MGRRRGKIDRIVFLCSYYSRTCAVLENRVILAAELGFQFSVPSLKYFLALKS